MVGTSSHRLLKSSCVDLKYVGVRALAGVFRVLEDAITPAHLEAVMDCLYHSSTTLQANTLRLLCAMANAHNYQVHYYYCIPYQVMKKV